LKKKVPVVTVATPEEASRLEGLALEATVALADVGAAMKEGLLGFCADVGLTVMFQVMLDEMTRRVGPKHARLPGREANWHGTTTGPVVLGGRLVSVERPRGRTKDGQEVELDSWAVFSSKDLLDQLTAERVLAGVATRRHGDVSEPLTQEIDDHARGTGRSSVSRRWKQATEAALAELMARDLSGLDVAVVMVDGTEVAGQCCVAALVVTTDGTKVPVGLWLGDTENKTVVTALLSDLVARGLETGAGLVVVIDGAKALAAGVAKVFGDKAVVQRCTIHKRRNVKGHLPQELGDKVDARLRLIFAGPDPAKGLDAAKRLAAETEARPPRRCRQPPRRPGGHVHRPSPRHRGEPGGDAHLHQRHRVDDLGRPHHDAQREELARRGDEETLGGGRGARSSALLPARPRLQADAGARSRPQPSPGAGTSRTQEGQP
jgi:transposase-like protein